MCRDCCEGYRDRMCDPDVGSGSAQLSSPRPAVGAAVDPITLAQVDEVTVTTLVDNTFDALLADDERTRRVSFGVATMAAAQFEGRTTAVGLVAEHGFSALITVRRGTSTTTVLFDTGLSPGAMV